MKFITLALTFLSTCAMAEFKVPALPNPVNDYANVLTPAGKEEIATKIIQLKKDTGVQLGVLLVDTLDGNDIETAAQAVAQKWKLGKKDENKGILLMVAIKDRQSRIEVGYGMEHVMTDATSRSILFSMRPDLKSKRFDSAIFLGVNSIYSTVKNFNEPVATPTKPKTEEANALIWFLIIAGFVIATIVFFPIMAHTFGLSRRKSSKTSRSQSRSKSDNTYVPVPFFSSSPSSYSSSDSSSSSSDSSSSSSDWGGSGGDSGGGGSSDSW